MQFSWNHLTIQSLTDARAMVRLFQESDPQVGAFDTETTGLNIRYDRPFLYQFGFVNEKTRKGYTFALDLREEPKLAYRTLMVWYRLAEDLRYMVAHNVKFDLHMLANIGCPYPHDNLTDTMIYIRLGHDALTQANGGPPLGLKDYAARYITRDAKHHEKLLSSERAAIAKEYNLKLKQKFAGHKPPFGQYKSWTIAAVDEFFSDVLNTWEDLPEELRDKYQQWHSELPEYLQHSTGRISSDQIRYSELNRNNLLHYGHLDIVYALEAFYQLEPVVHTRKQTAALRLEEQLIRPLFEMERVGFQVNRSYILESAERVRNYLRNRREDLYQQTGEKLSVGQHARIKTILQEQFQLQVPSTGAEQLDQVAADLKRTGENPEAVAFIDTVQELRTLEKWYVTYLQRFIKELHQGDRIYTTINQVGTVSGRVTSDFQQFPKKAIKDREGNELFHPRKMIQVSPEPYDSIAYLDYSQIELRLQALYTILLGEPDLNLCRAYMPYRCLRNGELFDPHNREHVLAWDQDWYLEEDPRKHWEPTDVHAATTTAATGLTPDHPDFAKLRSDIGKKTNFSKNYGAQFNRIRQMFPEKTEEEVRRIDEAYYKAFPGIKKYHEYCYHIIAAQGFGTNLFGVRYYGVSGHKLINMLIQGSGAYFLKQKIIELYQFSKAHDLQSRFQMNIHDELSWEVAKGEEHFLFEFKRIMEHWPDAPVPIVADVELTRKTWADKKEVHTLDEILSLDR